MALPASLKILAAGHPEQVKLDKFHHPAVRTPTTVELQEQGGDKGEINLNGYAAGDSASQCRQPKMHLIQRKNSSMRQRWR